jgi:hypothetical protein
MIFFNTTPLLLSCGHYSTHTHTPTRQHALYRREERGFTTSAAGLIGPGITSVNQTQYYAYLVLYEGPSYSIYCSVEISTAGSYDWRSQWLERPGNKTYNFKFNTEESFHVTKFIYITKYTLKKLIKNTFYITEFIGNIFTRIKIYITKSLIIQFICDKVYV